jgi:hypothetical protein
MEATLVCDSPYLTTMMILKQAGLESVGWLDLYYRDQAKYSAF